VIAGWCVTEVGRQPWTVYGLLRTAQSVSPSLTTHDVAISLAGYMLVYLVIYPSGLLLMLRIVREGLGLPAEQTSKIEAGRPEAPVLAGALGPAEGETR
jgi:cytochrome d ubiquinol oxidase subunit I